MNTFRICFLHPVFFLLLIFFFISEAFPQDTTNIPTQQIKLNLKPREGLDTSRINVFPLEFSRKKIALVLSGGGARGISQIGVLKALEKNNIKPDLIVGTSIGSVVGGLYSSGYTPEELEQVFKEVRWSNVLRLSDKLPRESLYLEQKKSQDKNLLTIPLDGFEPQFIPASLSSGLSITETINTLLLNARYHPKNSFFDLRIPFATVATDINSGDKVVLTKGNLTESIKASMTFPLLYSPIRLNGKELVDGGLTANIPIDVAEMLGADFTIVVNSTSPLRESEELKNPIHTADQILSITMEQLNNLQLQKADVIIEPDLDNYSSTDFSRIDYLVNKGESASMEVMGMIISKIDSLELSSSEYFNNFIINPVVVVHSETNEIEIINYIHENTDEKFVTFTSIERNLKELYKKGLFKNLFAEVKRENNSAMIHYYLEPNDRLREIQVENPFPILTDEIEKFKQKNSGEVINLNEYEKFHDRLLGILRENNISIARIEKFHVNAEGTLEINVTGGSIDEIVLNGNRTTNENVILREVQIPDGVVYKENLGISIRNVIGTNLFQQVSFDLEFDGLKSEPDLKIHLVEKSHRAIRFSARVDNERKLQLLVDLRDENIFGTGIELGFSGSGGLRNRFFQAEMKSNRFFSLPVTFKLNGYTGFRDINRYKQLINEPENDFSVEKIGEYRNVKNGVSFLLGTQLEKLGTIYGQAYYEFLEIKNISQSENLQEQLKVIKLKFGGLFDTQDVHPFPNKGLYINFFYETSQEKLGGNRSYAKLYMNLENYFKLNTSHNLRPRFIFGFADKTTPISELYFMGGENSFFGMREDEFRGRQILETSLEYRYLFPYKIFFDTYFKFRYDIGNVWENTEDIRFKDLRHGYGITTAFDTPVGEASFSVGRSFIIKRGLRQDSFVFGPYVFYFSIGYEL